jgi:protein-tyrosine phosphatase
MRAKRFVRDVKWRLRGVTLEEPRLPDAVQSILFVCLGNICRSPFAGRLAQQRFADLPIRFSSAGIHASQANKSPDAACQAAAEFGVSLENHRPALLTPHLVQSSDLIVVMELAQLELLRTSYPDAASRIVLLPLFDQEARGFDRSCIEDPFMRPLAEFRQCFGRIDRSISALVARLAL